MSVGTDGFVGTRSFGFREAVVWVRPGDRGEKGGRGSNEDGGRMGEERMRRKENERGDI